VVDDLGLNMAGYMLLPDLTKPATLQKQKVDSTQDHRYQEDLIRLSRAERDAK